MRLGLCTNNDFQTLYLDGIFACSSTYNLPCVVYSINKKNFKGGLVDRLRCYELFVFLLLCLVFFLSVFYFPRVAKLNTENFPMYCIVYADRE